jgi:hypothetical protein
MSFLNLITRMKNKQRSSAPVATERKPEESKALAEKKNPEVCEGFLGLFSE